MKYILIPIIAFGLTLSMIFGVEYNCPCSEAFPKYYGSPFVFMQDSLGSSMEYYYSVSGLLLNTIIWSALLIVLRYGAIKLIDNIHYKNLAVIAYKIGIGLLLLFAVSNIAIGYIGLGHGFGESLNYWYWNLDKEASDYRIKCIGSWKFDAVY